MTVSKHASAHAPRRTPIACALLIVGLLSWLGLSPGEPAPDFTAVNQDGKMVHLSAFKGKPVLIYFYPADETPGCTKEACSFRDEYSKFRSMGAVVLGVSRQDQKSHQEFKTHYHLPFDLLVDTDGSIAKAYGVGEIAGGKYHARESFLVGRDGQVVHHYTNVNPATHTEEVLRDLKAEKKSATEAPAAGSSARSTALSS